MTALIIIYFVQRQSFYRQPSDHSVAANFFSRDLILNQNALKDQEEIVLHIEKICENQGAAEKKGTALSDEHLQT